MTKDHTAQVARLKSTLTEAMQKKDRLPLRRHRDDDYWDEITIDTEKVHLRAFVVPRFKTSGLSGDEWRVSAKLILRRDGFREPIVERGFGRMHRDLAAYASHFIYQGAAHLLGEPKAVFVVKRKGIVLTEQTFPFFGDAAMGMGWHICVANEQGSDRAGATIPYHHLTDAEERGLCQQVGCSDKPVNVFRYKKLFYGDSDPERTFLPPKYDFEGQFTWYCARHTRRGDAGYEDSDKNLELVEGSGVAREHAEDESPAAFGGVIRTGDDS